MKITIKFVKALSSENKHFSMYVEEQFETSIIGYSFNHTFLDGNDYQAVAYCECLNVVYIVLLPCYL